jgi:hypothetical protein
MPKTVEFKITGADEIQAKLNRLPAEYSRKVLRTGLRDGGKVLLEEVKHLAKRLTGWMAEQAYMRVKTNNLDEGSAHITFTHKPNPKTNAPAINEALWKEFGVPAHGIAAEPFIRPAFEAKKQAAINAVVDGMKDALDTFK